MYIIYLNSLSPNTKTCKSDLCYQHKPLVIPGVTIFGRVGIGSNFLCDSIDKCHSVDTLKACSLGPLRTISLMRGHHDLPQLFGGQGLALKD